MEDRREFEAKLSAMDEKLDSRFKTTDQKLDDHGKDLREIRNSLVVIVQQAERLNSLTAMQNELRSDMGSIEQRLRIAESFQAACPQRSIASNIKALWLYVLGVSAAMGAAMLGHIFGGGNK